MGGPTLLSAGSVLPGEEIGQPLDGVHAWIRDDPLCDLGQSRKRHAARRRYLALRNIFRAQAAHDKNVNSF